MFSANLGKMNAASAHDYILHWQYPIIFTKYFRLLMEYEEHLRNTLKKGMDAESYSLHTFEALLTQSMENLGNSKPA